MSALKRKHDEEYEKRPRIDSQHPYLRDIKPESFTDIWGVVIKSSLPKPPKAFGKDFCSSLNLIDETLPAPGIPVNCFYRFWDRCPRVNMIGDIIHIKHAKIQKWQGEPQAVAYKETQFVLYNGTPSKIDETNAKSTDSIVKLHYQTHYENLVRNDETTISRLQTLQKFSKKYLESANMDLFKSEELKKICEITSEHEIVDITGKVISVSGDIEVNSNNIEGVTNTGEKPESYDNLFSTFSPAPQHTSSKLYSFITASNVNFYNSETTKCKISTSGFEYIKFTLWDGTINSNIPQTSNQQQKDKGFSKKGTLFPIYIPHRIFEQIPSLIKRGDFLQVRNITICSSHESHSHIPLHGIISEISLVDHIPLHCSIVSSLDKPICVSKIYSQYSQMPFSMIKWVKAYRNVGKFRIQARVISFEPERVENFSRRYCNVCKKWLCNDMMETKPNVCVHCGTILVWGYLIKVQLSDSSGTLYARLSLEHANNFFCIPATNLLTNKQSLIQLKNITSRLLTPIVYIDCCIVSYSLVNKMRYQIFGTSIALGHK